MGKTNQPSKAVDKLDTKDIEEQILRDIEAQRHLAKLREDGIDLQNEHRGILGFIVLAALSPAKQGKPSPPQRSRIRGLRSFPSRLASLAQELDDVFWRHVTRGDVVKRNAPKDFETLSTRMREAAQFLEGKLSLIGGRVSSDRDVFIGLARCFIRAYGTKHKHHDTELSHLLYIAHEKAGKPDKSPKYAEALKMRRYRQRKARHAATGGR
jgi:hypothetical protein